MAGITGTKQSNAADRILAQTAAEEAADAQAAAEAAAATATAAAASIGPAILEAAPTTPADGQHQRVILFGTSQEASNLAGDETNQGNGDSAPVSARGWANRAYQSLDHQFYTLVNAGIGGNRYDDMLTRLAGDVLAVPSDWVWMGGAPNDVVQGRSSAAIIADMDDMLDQLVADGRRVLLLTTASSTDVDTAPELAVLAAINAHARTRPAAYPGRVVVADAYAAITNPLTDLPFTNLTYDGTHYSDTGAALIGRLAAEAVRSITPPVVAGSRSEVGRPATTNLITNPFLDNTGWSASFIGTGAVALSWATPGAVGMTYTGVTAADEEGGVHLTNPLTAGFTPGTSLVRVRFRYRYAAITPLGIASNIGPVARLFARNIDNSQDGFAYSSLTASSEEEIPDRFPRSGAGVMETPWWEVGPNVDRLYVDGYFTGIASGWVQLSEPEVIVK